MLMPKNSEVTEKKLVLGDYITVQVSGLKTSQVNTGDMQVNREELFQRIQRQRAEVIQEIQKPAGELIDVRLRAAAGDKKGWSHSSVVMDEDEKFVAWSGSIFVINGKNKKPDQQYLIPQTYKLTPNTIGQGWVISYRRSIAGWKFKTENTG